MSLVLHSASFSMCCSKQGMYRNGEVQPRRCTGMAKSLHLHIWVLEYHGSENVTLDSIFRTSAHPGRGGVLCPSVHHRSHDQGGLCPGGSVYGEVCVWGVSVWGGGSFVPGVCLGSLSGGSLSWGSLSGGSLSGRPPHMVTCGWYTSYRNSFLYIIFTL